MNPKRLASFILSLFLVALFFFYKQTTTNTNLQAQTSCSATPISYVGPELAVAAAGENVVAAQNYNGVVSVINYLRRGEREPINTVTHKSLNPVNILRVDIDHNTPNEDLIYYAQRLREIGSSEFPCGIKTVVLSVEANNLTSEYWNYPNTSTSRTNIYTAAQDYAQKFIVFAQNLGGAYNLAPAPPDLFNGDYNADPWMDGFSSWPGACSYVDVNVADIFELDPTVDCINYSGSSRCNYMNVHEYQSAHMCGAPVVHFEGWGPRPSETLEITDQIAWYQSHPLPSGVSTATTLIIPVCNGTNYRDGGYNQWWYLITNDSGYHVFDGLGQERSLENCSLANNPYIPYSTDPRQGFQCLYYTNPNAEPTETLPLSALTQNIEADPEQHSYRPYPTCPYNPGYRDTIAWQCGNDLTARETLTLYHPEDTRNYDGEPIGTRLIECNQIGENPDTFLCDYEVYDRYFNISIDFKQSELPVLGLTRQPYVDNADNWNDAPGNYETDNAQKMNYYLSWYMNGVVDIAERNPVYTSYLYPSDAIGERAKTDTIDLINYSGPINKLLPWRIQNKEREDEIYPEQNNKHNQISVCLTQLNVPGWVRILEGIPLPFPLPIIGDIADFTVPFPCWVHRDETQWDDVGNVVLRQLFSGSVTNTFINRISEWQGETNDFPRVPPADEDYITDEGFDFQSYHRDYIQWRGGTCLYINGLGFSGFYVCINDENDILKEDLWAETWSYVPYTSMEDITGFATANTTHTQQPSSDIQNLYVTFNPDDFNGIFGTYIADGQYRNLYFSHIEEITEDAEILQSTYLPYGENAYTIDYESVHTGPYVVPNHCEILDSTFGGGDPLRPEHEYLEGQPTFVRSPHLNPAAEFGDSIPVEGRLNYTGNFTCEYQHIIDNSCYVNCIISQYPNDSKWCTNPDSCPSSYNFDSNDAYCYNLIPGIPLGWCYDRAALTASINQSIEENGYTNIQCYDNCSYWTDCTITAAASTSLFTVMPRSEDIWKAYVDGEMSIFKKMYPLITQDENQRPLTEIKDIPGRTQAVYQSTALLDAVRSETIVGNPSTGTSGAGNQPLPGDIFFPHLASLEDYFLTHLQIALRPYGTIHPPLTGGEEQGGMGINPTDISPTDELLACYDESVTQSYINSVSMNIFRGTPIENALEAAAYKYQINPCVLWAILSIEGTRIRATVINPIPGVNEERILTSAWEYANPLQVFTDQFGITNYSDAELLFERAYCSSNYAGASGPFQLLSGTWQTYQNASNSYLGQHVGNPCNFTDAVFAAAAMIADKNEIYGGMSLWTLDNPEPFCYVGEGYYGSCRMEPYTCRLGTNYCDYILDYCEIEGSCSAYRDTNPR